MTVWLIGGTSESVLLSQALSSLSLPCLISVTTPSARSLYPFSPFLRVSVGLITETTIQDFCQENLIKIIIDASHPYAVEISKLAMNCGLPYLRYERRALQGDDGTIDLDSFETLIGGDYLAGERVLLTVGCKALKLFKDWHDRSTLFTRILPSESSLTAAEAAGFRSDRIIALRPPVAENLECSLWKALSISTVVTKASGVAGGEEVKKKVARELGVSLIVISRPPIIYPSQTDNIDDVIDFCNSHLAYV